MLNIQQRRFKNLLSQSRRKLQLGICLLEILSTTSILSILISVTVPNYNSFIVDMRVDNEISRVTRLILAARNYAINSQNNTVICPLNESGVCTENWHEELSVFVDSNNNKRFDGHNKELLVTTKSPILVGDKLTYAKNRKSITYKPTGRLSGLSNGTFRYCPQGYIDKSRGVVIAISGRTYATSDIDKDGIDETRSNKAIVCG